MRFDRVLTIYVFHRLRKIYQQYRGVRVPILMYHSISDNPENASHPYFKTNTSPQVFEEHMQFLHEGKYSVISLLDAADLLSSNHSVTCPTTQNVSLSTDQPKCVVLTFDDGFADFYTCAFPILRKYGFVSTVFLPTGFISDDGVNFKGRRCLSWKEVRTLSTEGVTFGGHTVSYPKLSDLSWAYIESELRESRATIEERIGKPIKCFSYPYAFPEEKQKFKARLRVVLTESGYTNGVTTILGTARHGEDRLFLPRIPVNSDDDRAFFLAKLEGGYDWMHGLQQGIKLLKQRLNQGHEKRSI